MQRINAHHERFQTSDSLVDEIEELARDDCPASPKNVLFGDRYSSETRDDHVQVGKGQVRPDTFSDTSY